MKNVISLIVLVFAAAISNAQSIPNAGFENWTNPNGYNIPDSWANLNTMTSMSGVYTCTKGTPGNPGSSYIKLVSKPVSGMGVMPGIAVSGLLDESTLVPISGFAYTQRPVALTGKWQYMGYSNDIGSISAYLTKWNAALNKRDTIGSVFQSLTGMIMSWEDFSFPFVYTNSNTPDSCTIVLNSSGSVPVANSYLYVDNLDFTSATAGVDQTKTGQFSLYPNPSEDQVNLDLSGLKSTAKLIEIVDQQGKVIWSETADLSLLQTIPTKQLSSNTYLLRIETADGTITQQFIKR